MKDILVGTVIIGTMALGFVWYMHCTRNYERDMREYRQQNAEAAWRQETLDRSNRTGIPIEAIRQGR